MTNFSTFIVNNAQELMNNANGAPCATSDLIPSDELVKNIVAFASAYEYYDANGYELEIFLN
ncbi:MAG: hypothetical protein ACK5IQ_07595 [Bacteroidales bacterium]